MKYIANPVEVDAFKIEKVTVGGDGCFHCLLEDGRKMEPSAGMVARMEPKSGDYWVVQSDGYEYLNPKEVFERKYHAA
jgi:hypothetical protein